MTEDAVKNILGDLPLPKDIVSGLVQNAKGAKKEFSDGVRKEFREYLSKLDLTKLVSNALENYDFNIQATVTLKKKMVTQNLMWLSLRKIKKMKSPRLSI